MILELTLFDLTCDGCSQSLSECSDLVYRTDGEAYDDAIDRDWLIKDVDGVYGAGKHLCPSCSENG